eukprot:m.14792 g.14792  ORF g.14792 m.14792 type:complete len:55 (-) comp6430_c0_seq1:2129-2293(-)
MTVLLDCDTRSPLNVLKLLRYTEPTIFKPPLQKAFDCIRNSIRHLTVCALRTCI